MRVPGTKMVVERRLDASGRTTRITTNSSDHVSHQLPTKMVTVCLTFSFVSGYMSRDVSAPRRKHLHSQSQTSPLTRTLVPAKFHRYYTSFQCVKKRDIEICKALYYTLASAIRLQGIKERELP